ncbi:hypothetical protein niasHS_010944 [Heterodera schachtii]|uniref:TGF-beta family profile domain-containing protein n=1 Tax=Heterodera schachtii TaxID=97005 RepID=A0ABD2IVJ6_HETSC
MSSQKAHIQPKQTVKTTTTISLPNGALNSEERLLLRRAFLRKFGLDTLISVTNYGEKKAEKVPPYIWALYGKQSANPEVETIRHYAVSTHAQEDGIVWMAFNLSATGRNAKKERVVRAELQLPKTTETKGTVHRVGQLRERPSREGVGTELALGGGGELADLLREHPTDREQLVLAWRLPPGSDPLATELLEGVALIVFTNSEKYEGRTIWQKGTAKKRTKRWVSSQRTNSASKANDDDDETENSSKRRRHRTHRKTAESEQRQQCRRTALYVDFRELNWDDWIIAPTGYEAYQCRGRCAHPLPAKLNTTNHAIVQSLIHSIDPHSVSAPSCVPVQMSAISILYKDINNVIVVKTYADMRVDSCGCH